MDREGNQLEDAVGESCGERKDEVNDGESVGNGRWGSAESEERWSESEQMSLFQSPCPPPEPPDPGLPPWPDLSFSKKGGSGTSGEAGRTGGAGDSRTGTNR